MQINLKRWGLWIPPMLAGMTMVSTGAHAATLTIDVGNVRNARGHVHIEACPQDRFLKDDCPYSGETAAQAGVTSVVIRNLPPGRYALQATHDENDNHRVDRALFGIPREGVGFSNDARISLGPPKWADAMIVVTGDARLHLTMRYFLGASGPAR
jgi:uncharacterized protein (DUF2141 family)